MIHLLVLEINNKQIAMKTLKFPDAAGSRRPSTKKSMAGSRRPSMKNNTPGSLRPSTHKFERRASAPMPTMNEKENRHIKESSIAE
jgi:hypothetical protein